MKILMIVPALGSIYGGPSKSVIELAEAIGKRGVNIDVVTTNANGDERINAEGVTKTSKT